MMAIKIFVSRTIFRAVVFICPVNHILLGQVFFFLNFIHRFGGFIGEIFGENCFDFVQIFFRNTVSVKP
jgi:hypothetical protein